jgi:uncharacterized protein YkwD
MTVRDSARRRTRLVIAAALAAVAVLATVLGSTAQAGAQTSALAADASDRGVLSYQSAIFTASNTVRRLHDRSKFRHQSCVQHYAVRQAKRMAAQQQMFHQDLRPVLRNCHLRKAGENVAYGFLTGLSVVLDGWMKSPEHRRNLLDGDFRLLGSGARLGDDGLWYAVQVFGRHR